MRHYIANLRDIEFNLFEVLRLDSILGSAKYHDLDIDTARTMLDEVARLAEGLVAESFADADRNPPPFDPEHHIVIVPAELAKSLQAVKDTGWWRVGIAEDVELTFGAHGLPAVGYLVGDVHNGIAQMFTVIEHARMTIGVKAAGTLSTGYLNALAFAKERVQGADMTQMTDKTAPRVTIIHHPDVRRSLMTQKAYAEGLRALYMYAAAHQDGAVAQQVSGADPQMAHRVDDLLLPIVKDVGSERAYEVLTESLQTLGGSGFLQDYPIEQYIRDAKIDFLYEGTTAIQALDFIFRKIVRDRGEALAHVASQLTHTIENCDEALRPQADLLQTALNDVQAMTATLTGCLMAAAENPTEIYKVGLASVRFLLAVGDLIIGWRLLVQAGVARAALAGSPSDEAFYQGKIATATFFATNMLPKLTALRGIVEKLDDDIMRIPESAF